nr:hypothetical protein [Natronococcus pandeyae]
MDLATRIDAYRQRVLAFVRRMYEGPILGAASLLVDREVADTWIRGLYHGMVSHPTYEIIEAEAEDLEDAFLLACFPDAFGVPSPVSYYTAELLPYIEDEYEAWQRRTWDRWSLVERKGEQFHPV